MRGRPTAISSARELLVSAASTIVSVALGERSYDIEIGSGILAGSGARFRSWLQRRGGSVPSTPSALIVTDAHVGPRHAATVSASLSADGWKSQTIVLPAGETSKSLDVVSQVYDRLIDMQADRRTVVIAVGGGVMGDLAGFVAASWVRGVPFIQVPTTLLAAVDSSVGGKTGVNHPRAKNMIGAFYQPWGVAIDIDAFQTLPEREFRAGLAEVVKYGVILDEAFFAGLEAGIERIQVRDPAILQRIVAASCRFKADVVEKDEFERTGLRAILNYGHTFAHAFEALCGYGELLHGEAVSIGMLYASRLAERRGLIDASVTWRQRSLLERLGLPVALPAGSALTNEAVLGRMRLDKKTVGGSLRFILPRKIGHVETFADVPELDVCAVLDELRPH